MVVGYGVTVPEGSLPVYSTDTEEQARQLIVATCPLSWSGEYVAPELVREQTIENLFAFGDRLAAMAESLGIA